MKPELKLVEDTGSELPVSEFVAQPQQEEMPFAIVEGEPLTQLPRDLYIPPDALQVFLEAFEGPLDLLLYLIRRQNLDILDIPIAEITRQYMKYIDVMQEMQLELAGEYLLMAAMLAEIKSRMLLPRSSSADGAEEDDPRAELVRRLQEYERFKKAAEDIDQLHRLERDALVASAELVERKVVRVQPQVSMQEMLLAFKEVVTRSDMFTHHHVRRERLSVRARMSEILDRLREQAWIDFTKLFIPEEGRMGVTVTFIALLELMKEGMLEIVQTEVYGVIHVRPAAGARNLSLVAKETAATGDVENEAALSQPALPDEDQPWEPEFAPELQLDANATEQEFNEQTAEATSSIAGIDTTVVDIIDDDVNASLSPDSRELK
jgi:segregation and condensation protein A